MIKSPNGRFSSNGSWTDCGYALLQRNEKTLDGLNRRIRDLPRLGHVILRGGAFRWSPSRPPASRRREIVVECYGTAIRRIHPTSESATM
jgi:hypothetical protein